MLIYTTVSIPKRMSKMAAAPIEHTQIHQQFSATLIQFSVVYIFAVRERVRVQLNYSNHYEI